MPAPAVVSKPYQTPNILRTVCRVMDSEGHNLWIGYSDGGGSYLRGEYAPEVSGAVINFAITTMQVRLPDGTIGMQPFNANCTLNFVVNDVVIASKDVLGTDAVAYFDIPIDQLPDGEATMGSTGHPYYVSLDYPLSIRKGAKAAPSTQFAVVDGSYSAIKNAEWFGGPVKHQLAWLPAVWKPTVQPLPPRSYPPVPVLAGQHLLAFTAIAPRRPWDPYRPSYLPSGAMTGANRQNYFYADVQSAFPLWPVREGPRGDGSITCPTSLRETLRPDFATNGKGIGTDPWRVFTFDSAGTIRTIAGWVHDDPQPYTNAPRFQQHYPMPQPRFRGRWIGALPTAKWFHELWDVAVDTDTIAIDPNSTPVGNPPEKTHVVGVRYLVCDTQNDRLVWVVSSPTSREDEPTLEEFIVIPGGRPWNCEIVGNVVYVSLQTGGQVRAYDKTTRELLWWVPITMPTGLRYQDGVLTVGSSPYGAPRGFYKIDVATRAVTLFSDVTALCDNNTNFLNLAISDGTFGPRGSVFFLSFNDANHGYPVMLDTTGKHVDWKPVVAGQVQRGQPGPYGWTPGALPLTYGTAVSTANGRMTWGTVQEGLCRVSAVLPTDQPLPPLFVQGQQEFYLKGYPLTDGDGGFGFVGSSRFGESAAIDDYLIGYGHTADITAPVTPPPVITPPVTPPVVTPPTTNPPPPTMTLEIWKPSSGTVYHWVDNNAHYYKLPWAPAVAGNWNWTRMPDGRVTPAAYLMWDGPVGYGQRADGTCFSLVDGTDTVCPIGAPITPPAPPAPPAVAPTISGFTATPAAIVSGQSATLDATIAGTAPVALTLNGAPVTLPATVTPLVGTTYVLVATNAAGSTPASVAVAVAPPPATKADVQAALDTAQSALTALAGVVARLPGA